MYNAAFILLLLGLSHIQCGPVQAGGDDSAPDSASPDSADTSADGSSGSAVEAKSAPVSSDATQSIPVPPQGAGSLQRPDGIGDYLAQIRRSGLHMTVDSVNEGYKKKNRNSYEDAGIKIHNRNNSDFTRNGQVQSFEGPGFKLRTAILTENNNGKIKSAVVTSQDSEKNYTRSRDRLTQFVGTLDTDQFSSGALLNDHSNHVVSGSVRQQADGNRESRLRKQTADDLVRGSFLKTGNLTINARYQSNAFSDRQKLISDIVLGDSASSDNSSAAATPPAGSNATSGDDQDDS